MTDYNALDAFTQAISNTGETPTSFVDMQCLLGFRAVKYVLNRGTNGGSGAAFVYWLSPDKIDTSGLYYNQSVPWSQITLVENINTVYPAYSW